MNKEISFSPLQQKALAVFAAGKVEVLGLGGAKGGGKSWFIRTRQVLRRLQYPGTVGLIVRKTLPELEKNHIRKIQMEWPDLLYDYKDQKHQFRFKNGSILDLTYIDGEQDLDRLQGAEYDDIDIDESEHHSKLVFTTLRSCLRTTNRDIRPTMILGFNWGGEGHAWLKRMFWRKYMVKTKPEGTPAEDWELIKKADTWESVEHWDDGERPDQFAFLQVFWYDNPHLDDGYIDRLNALPEELRKAWRDGNPDIFEGQFFSEFGIHLRERPYHIAVNKANLYGSLDYGDGAGENAGATSFGLWHLDENGLPHRLFTYYKRNQTASVYAREIINAIQSFPYTYGVMPKIIWADPSIFIKKRDSFARVGEEQSRSIADIFADHGLVLTPANNDRINGWRVMREYFSRDILTGMPKSRYWEGYNEEYEEYVPAVPYSKTNRDDIKKGGEDHVVDEARYGFVGMMNVFTKKKVSSAKQGPAERLQPMKTRLNSLFFSRKVA